MIMTRGWIINTSDVNDDVITVSRDVRVNDANKVVRLNDLTNIWEEVR